MKQLAILIMIILCLQLTTAQIMIDAQGVQQQAQGIISAIKAWFVESAFCTPNWTYTDTCVENDTIIRQYTDYNNCGESPPSDSGSFQGWCNYCSYNLVESDIDNCPAYDGEATHNITVFDANWINCCFSTNSSDDCYRDDSNTFNRTYFETEVCEVESSMWELGVIILPFLFGILLIIGSVGLSQEHTALKIFMFVLSFITIFSSMHFASIIIAFRYPVLTELQDALGTTVFWAGRLLFILIAYFVIYVFVKMVHYSAQKKKEKLEY